MEALILDTVREGYGLDQVRNTMTVAELIGYLEQFDDEMPVYLGFDNRYTYGGITEHRFETIYDDGGDGL